MKYRVLKPVRINRKMHVPNYKSVEHKTGTGDIIMIDVVAEPPVLIELPPKKDDFAASIPEEKAGLWEKIWDDTIKEWVRLKFVAEHHDASVVGKKKGDEKA